ncbi:uncharacterized protein IL334_002543 [Kwoniella shivajii]|uniref:Uncharacterized protein n=1 Tax=Kwoniella shivajii TaxID=564305 RepID=A0ABZ1CV39_9TREE|nr:hypothetical protein IL334_002543 [Kwoniella shivajii]
MSSTSTDPSYSAISNINFTGGFPTSADLAPSIVFLVLYVLVTPLLLWRWARKSDRTLILIRPTIFHTCRIAMLAIRAYMSKNTYGEGLLIAELVLVSIGFLFLIEPVVACWKLQIDSYLSEEDRPTWVRRLALLLKFTVLAAIGTAIAGSALISNAIKNPDQLNTVKHLRQASNVLSFGAVTVVAIAAILTWRRFTLDTRGTAFIVLTSACLIVVAVYRMVQTFSTNSSAPVRSRAAFWGLQMVFEFLAFILILSISIPTWFPGQKGRIARNGLDEEMSPTSRSGHNGPAKANA